MPENIIKQSWLDQIIRLQAYLERLYQKYKQLYPGQLFIVAIETDNRFLISLFVLSTWKLPICLFPVSKQYPEEFKTQLLKQCGVRLIFTDRLDLNNFPYSIFSIHQLLDDLVIKIDQLPTLLNLGLLSDQIESSPAINEKNNPIKLIVTTSGSTQKPKAVYLSKNSILNHCYNSRERIKVDNNSIWLNCLALNHVAGLMIFYRLMAANGRVLLHTKFDIDKIIEDVSSYNISHISLVPVMLQKLLDRLKQKNAPVSLFCDKLEYLLIGGGTFSQVLFNQARLSGLPIIYGYGSSESCSHITLTGLENIMIPSMYKDKISSGKSLSGVEIKIHKISSNNKVGLILYRGDMLMSGYANPGYQTGVGIDKEWFYSQDLGYINSQDELFVMGRTDEVMVSV